jgi:prophage tail gpP-like protein
MYQSKKNDQDEIEQNRVSIEVGGYVYSGWKNISITNSISELSGKFALDVSEKWDGQTDGWEIQAGDSCTVKIGSDVMITGYVDVNSATFDANAHTITAEGRDKAGDLVDCTCEAREYVNQSFEFILKDLVKPFGINVRTQLEGDDAGYTKTTAIKDAKNGGKRLPRKSVKNDESVYSAIQKMAEVQGVLVVSDKSGGLLITRAGLAGRCNDALVLGENLLSVDYSKDFTEVFSKITVKGQAHGATSKTGQKLDRKSSVLGSGEIEREKSNGIVGRYRPLTISASEQVDSSRAKTQAQWEASRREARATKLSVKVQGWRESNGELWTINKLVRVKCPWVRQDTDFVIDSIEFAIDESGTTAKMELVVPQAYAPNPELTKNKEAKRETRGAQNKGNIR